MLAKHDFSYLSPYLFEWNESKLPIGHINLYNKMEFLGFFEKMI